jgi:A/G-specific adenine glycosylase
VSRRKSFGKIREKENSLLSRFNRIMRKDGPSEEAIRVFRKIIHAYFRESGRDLPWRETRDPYKILVAEIMLQQTQVGRVREKYPLFIRKFPGISDLATAPLVEILKAWQGLGYNRRALALKKLAGIVMEEYHGTLPAGEGELMKLPGIGKYSASAIATFAHNKPTLFIETNIRSVFIHFFFHDRENIGDALIMPLIERTLDAANPREWYYALMDYGAMMKADNRNPNRRSAHYRRQTPFQGSDRQVRGRILRALTEKGLSERALTGQLQIEPSRVGRCLDQLLSEGFLRKQGKTYVIA